VEQALLLTGIGGQGIQFAAEVIARAALAEGHHVLLFGVYAGAMRGMNTDATVVIGDAPVVSPPIVSRAEWALAMHDRYWAPVAARLREGATALFDEASFSAALPPGVRGVAVPAARVATEAGSEQAAALVLAAAFGARSGLVGVEALVRSMTEALPPYRAAQAPVNAAAIEAGYAWATEGAAA
jgi:Pyruvate/2-oxoacid:ferredoxin oxidoreductase gamma subunit